MSFDITEWLEKEISDTVRLTEEQLDEAADFAMKKLTDTSPKYTGKYPSKKDKAYSNSWKIKRDKKTKARIIYNKFGGLTHILEHGTNDRYTRLGYKRGKGSPRRHIDNAYQDTLQKINELINNI